MLHEGIAFLNGKPGGYIRYDKVVGAVIFYNKAICDVFDILIMVVNII